MGVHKQAQWRWKSNHKQGKTGLQGIGPSRRNISWRNIFSNCQDGVNQNILAYASFKNIKVYQMDVKSTFLNGELEEEVYIE